MKKFSYVITDSLGIHARPGGELAKVAKQFTSSVKVDCNGKSVDGKKLIALMSLCAKQGHQLDVSVEGADEEAAAAAVEKYLKEHL